MGSSVGRLFRVTTFGESHGPAIGVIIEGCPPGLTLDLEQLQLDLDRRRPGQSDLTTSRQESDRVELLSGLFEGQTTGTPIALLIRNKDAHSRSYDGVKELYRPGHGDATYMARYGLRDYRGGGRASARETAARVAAGGVARQWLSARYGIEVIAWVDQVSAHRAKIDPNTVTHAEVEAQLTRCPDHEYHLLFDSLIRTAKEEGDTLGGVIGGVARGVPAGWGAPVCDKLEADLAKACLSLPACKGFEVGSGFDGVTLRGSQHNDEWTPPKNPTNRPGAVIPTTNTNRAGGVLAGISTGAPITIRAAFKPVSTHFKTQATITHSGEPVLFQNEGRHDPCVLPRAVPLVEAAMSLTLMDHALQTLALDRGYD